MPSARAAEDVEVGGTAQLRRDGQLLGSRSSRALPGSARLGCEDRQRVPEARQRGQLLAVLLQVPGQPHVAGQLAATGIGTASAVRVQYPVAAQEAHRRRLHVRMLHRHCGAMATGEPILRYGIDSGAPLVDVRRGT